MPWLPSRQGDPPRRPSWLTAQAFAHRGLYGQDIPENSRAAFLAAIAAGFGIELDVQPCRGSDALVFHDSSLDRLCETGGRLQRLTAAQAGAIRLKGSDETIPTLADALALISGRTPLLIEIKAPRLGWRPFCLRVADALRDYPGPVAIMSFSSAVVGWFSNHAPHLIRGLVTSEEGRRKIIAPRGLALRTARPDFLAHDVRSLPSAFAERARSEGVAILVWTVRTAAEKDRALRYGDQIIHELPGDQQ